MAGMITMADPVWYNKNKTKKIAPSKFYEPKIIPDFIQAEPVTENVSGFFNVPTDEFEDENGNIRELQF